MNEPLSLREKNFGAGEPPSSSRLAVPVSHLRAPRSGGQARAVLTETVAEFWRRGGYTKRVLRIFLISIHP